MPENEAMKELRPRETTQPGILLDNAVVLDDILKDPALSTGARLLWVMLTEHQGSSIKCFPSQEMLAIPLGVKVRQLQSDIKELENYTRGDPPEPSPLISVKRVRVEKEGKSRNICILLRQPFLAVNRMANAEEGHVADGGNAQYSAHRSEGDSQHTAATPPAMSSENGDTVPDGLPSGDTQSFAPRSECGAQDTAVGPAPILADEGNTQHFAHWSEGDTEDTAAARPETRTEEGNAPDAAAWGANGGAVSAGALSDDAQSFALQTGGATEDTAAGPPGSPEDGAPGPDDMPPGDTQSIARSSGGDQQDPVAALPASPSADGGALQGGAPPNTHRGSARAVARPIGRFT
jgi:hypothetical protein